MKETPIDVEILGITPYTLSILGAVFAKRVP